MYSHWRIRDCDQVEEGDRRCYTRAICISGALLTCGFMFHILPSATERSSLPLWGTHLAKNCCESTLKDKKLGYEREIVS